MSRATDAKMTTVLTGVLTGIIVAGIGVGLVTWADAREANKKVDAVVTVALPEIRSAHIKLRADLALHEIEAAAIANDITWIKSALQAKGFKPEK